MEMVCQGEYIKFLHIITHGEVGVVDRIEGDRFQFFRIDLSVGQNALVCADVHDLTDYNAYSKL